MVPGFTVVPGRWIVPVGVPLRRADDGFGRVIVRGAVLLGAGVTALGERVIVCGIDRLIDDEPELALRGV